MSMCSSIVPTGAGASVGAHDASAAQQSARAGILHESFGEPAEVVLWAISCTATAIECARCAAAAIADPCLAHAESVP
ncbi:MAG: hypothetical protein DMD26_11600, partial [Gemmatimonadetes bacterium]